MARKLTQKQCIERFTKTHGNTYDYSNTVYVSGHGGNTELFDNDILGLA